jgi:putative intracellular protease/amidase
MTPRPGRFIEDPLLPEPGRPEAEARRRAARPRVAVLMYPGCIFFEIAAVVELLAAHCELGYYTPDGTVHAASNGTRIAVDGPYADAAAADLRCVIVPGGDPDSIIDAGRANACLVAAHARGAWLAGICAGSLVIARAGLLKGRRATHNYTAEHAAPEVVACTAPIYDGIVFERADLVVDAPFITAQHWARAPFAAAVAQALGVMSAAEAAHYLQQQAFSYGAPA